MAERSTKYGANLSVRVPRDAAERLREMAEADDRAPTAVARRFILEGLQRETARAAGGATG